MNWHAILGEWGAGGEGGVVCMEAGDKCYMYILCLGASTQLSNVDHVLSSRQNFHLIKFPKISHNH